MEDDELLVTKLSTPMLVPQALIDDCHVNLLDYLANPHLRPAPRVLTRREKFAKLVTAKRIAVAERVYKFIAGTDAADIHWGDY